MPYYYYYYIFIKNKTPQYHFYLLVKQNLKNKGKDKTLAP